jgi:hypothetical protein
MPLMGRFFTQQEGATIVGMSQRFVICSGRADLKVILRYLARISKLDR